MAGTTRNIGIPYREGGDRAWVASDNKAAYEKIDAEVQMLKDQVAASQRPFVVTDGAGNWSVKTGLGETVAVSSNGAGDWSVHL